MYNQWLLTTKDIFIKLHLKKKIPQFWNKKDGFPEICPLDAEKTGCMLLKIR